MRKFEQVVIAAGAFALATVAAAAPSQARA